MILTTTQQIEGHTIREYKGVVTGETIIGANFVKDFSQASATSWADAPAVTRRCCAKQRTLR